MKKSIGLNVKAPAKACQDGKCAWHGRISVRGQVFAGTVLSAKAHNTAIIEFGFNHYVPKYERYEHRSSRIVAHNPDCLHVKEGDRVVIAECRPLAKTKSFVVVGMAK